jgi:hypothetical protein
MPRPISQFPAPLKTDLEMLAALLAAGGLRRPHAYATVTTYLDRLVQKGYVHGQPSGEGRGAGAGAAGRGQPTICDEVILGKMARRLTRHTRPSSWGTRGVSLDH